MTWERLPQFWPIESNQVRAMTVRQNELYIGTGGPNFQNAQVWILRGDKWVKHSHFDQRKVACLTTDSQDRLYIGVGTPHSSEDHYKGEAKVWRYDVNNNYELLNHFFDYDVIYSMCWHNGKLHVGTMAEDRPGTAAIFRYDDPGWVKITHTNGWPSSNSYSAAYELWSHNGDLYAGMFSKSQGWGDVLKLTSSGWQNLDGPDSTIALSFAEYNGYLVCGFENNNQNPNPVMYYENEWKPLGTAPAEWAEKGMSLPNHMLTDPLTGHLYVGVGGPAGCLSVWKYDGTWTKIAGDGVNGSWIHSINNQIEWIYRMLIKDQVLYVGMAGNNTAEVWKLAL